MDLMQSLIASKLLGGGGGSEPVLKTKSIYENGTYAASADEADGYSQVSVNVPAPTLVTRNITVNGTINKNADGVNGYSQIVTNVQSPTTPTEQLRVTQNGTYYPSSTPQATIAAPSIPDDVETEVTAMSTMLNSDKLWIDYTNKTTSETSDVKIYPVNIATYSANQDKKDKTLVVYEDSNHYIYVTKSLSSLYVLQRGFTITSFDCGNLDPLIDEVIVNVSPNVGTKSITDNGTYNASSDSLDGYSQVVVNVAGGGTPDELSTTEPRMRYKTEGASSYVTNNDGSMNWTWNTSNAIGNCFIGQVPLKNAKKIIINIDEYGENYQHRASVDTRNFNTAIGVTDISLGDSYVDLDSLQTNNHLITDVEFNGNTYYGETNIEEEVDLTPYLGQDLYLFIQIPGVTLTGFKITVLYDKFGVYEYHWSNDGKICVRKETGCTKWFFCGLTKESGDMAVPEELVPYLPDFEAPSSAMNTKGYSDTSGTWPDKWIGFVYPGTANVKIRSWNNYGDLAGGTFWGVLDITHYPFINQDNPYVDPMDIKVIDETLLNKTIISNGTYRAEDEGYSGYGEITVAAPVPKADIGYNKIFKDGLTDIYFDANNGKINSYWDKSNPTGGTIGNSIQGRTDLNGVISALHITGNITDSWAHYNSSTLERCQFVVGFTDRLWNEAILVGYNDNGSVYIKEEVELTNVQSTSVDIFINLKDAQYQQYASTPKYLFISLFGIEGEFKVDLIPDVAEIHVPYSNICTCYHMGDIPAVVGKKSMISEWKTGTNIGCSWNGTIDLMAAGYSKMHYRAYIGAESYDDKVNQNIRPVIIGVSPNTYSTNQYVNQSTASSYYSVYDIYLSEDYKDVYVEGTIDFSNETDPQYLLIVATGHNFEMLDMWFE